RRIVDIVALAVIYYTTARIGQQLAIPPGNVTPVWIPSGIILAAVLIRGFHLWPGIFLGAFIGNVWAYFDPSSTSLMLRAIVSGSANGIGDTLCAVIPAWLIIRTTGTSNPMGRVSHVGVFLLYGALLGPGISALFGVTGLASMGFLPWESYIYVLATWWTGDSIGVLILAPALLMWATRRGALELGTEFALFAVALVLASLLCLGVLPVTGNVQLTTFLILPLLIWAVFRLDHRILFSALLLVAVFAITASAVRMGIYSEKPLNEVLIELQLFLAAMSISIFFLSSVVEEREKTKHQLERTVEQQEMHVQERTRQLQSQQIFLNSLLENVQDGIVACDKEGKLSLFNHATRELHGIEQKALPPEQWAEHYNLYQADGKTPMKKEDIPLFRAYMGEKVKDVEMVIVPNKGEPRTLLTSGTAMVDDSGNRLGAVVSMHDITERKHYEGALIAARREAEIANRAKSAFLANMSHELRTPLNAVLGFSEMLMNDPAVTSDQRSTLKIIHRSGDHLLGLLDDVLDLARIEAGGIDLVEEPFDLGDVLRDVTDMMSVRAKQDGLQLDFVQSSSFPRYVVADRGKIRQILINLIGNAIKFTDKGGVSLSLSVLTDQESDQHNLLFEIQDTGPGIAKMDQKRIFEPFVQIGFKAGMGTGLGLAICKQYVELMQGEVSVENEPGAGALFRVMIPIRLAARDQIDRLPLSPGHVIGLFPDQAAIRMMIVEDQPENRLLLNRLLTKVGFEVEEVENGEQAVELFKRRPPDLIWMDRRMPVLDGLEATRRIRQLPGGDKVKIVAITASVLRHQRDEIMDSGHDDFVHKPYRSEEIYDCIRRQLNVRFIYDEVDEEVPVEKITPPAPEAVSALPVALRESMKSAVVELNIEQIVALADEVEKLDAELAQTIRQAVERLNMSELLAWLESDPDSE
ncbi:MAG: MASE1 domain-containing protein, partial [Sedimenticola sp.]